MTPLVGKFQEMQLAAVSRASQHCQKAKGTLRKGGGILLASTIILLALGNTVLLPLFPISVTCGLVLLAIGLGTALWKTRPPPDHFKGLTVEKDTSVAFRRTAAEEWQEATKDWVFV